MANSRVSRGRKIQNQAAEYFKEGGWVQAKSTPASLPGKDVENMPGWSVEVKGSRDNPLPAALRQAAGNAEEGETPLVVWCPDGYGEKRIDEWVVAFTFKDAVELMRKAEGFVSHEREEDPDGWERSRLSGCGHWADTWFNRGICPEPCGMMHYHCVECGAIDGYCAIREMGTEKPELEKRVEALEEKVANLPSGEAHREARIRSMDSGWVP